MPANPTITAALPTPSARRAGHEAPSQNPTITANSKGNGAVTGEVRTLLRIEGLALFCAATLFYWISGASWWLFAVLLLAPDLSFLAYLAGPRLGAAGYNALHATIGPLLPALASMVMHWPLAGSIALIRL